MARGNKVVVVATLLVEGAKLDEAVAHHVRIGCQSCAYLIHSIFSDLIPVFLMAVNDLQLAAILVTDSRCHLQVFF